MCVGGLVVASVDWDHIFWLPSLMSVHNLLDGLNVRASSPCVISVSATYSHSLWLVLCFHMP